MDLYVPPRAAAGAVIIVFHGGGMTGGDKRDVAEFCGRLSDRGYPALSCNYTLAAPGSPSWPQSVRDAKNVVLWARGDGRSGFGLPDRIVVAGSSAGGYLAMMAAATAGTPPLETLPHFPSAYRVHGFVSMWGGSDLVWQVRSYGQDPALTAYLGAAMEPGTEDLYRNASPISHLDLFDPPGLLFHGTGDAIVPYGHSARMQKAMQALGIPASLTSRSGAGHGFDDWGGQTAMADRVADALPRLLAWRSRRPDVDGDGLVTAADLSAYSAAYVARAPSADVNADSTVDRVDFLSFFDAFCYWSRR